MLVVREGSLGWCGGHGLEMVCCFCCSQVFGSGLENGLDHGARPQPRAQTRKSSSFIHFINFEGLVNNIGRSELNTTGQLIAFQ